MIKSKINNFLSKGFTPHHFLDSIFRIGRKNKSNRKPKSLGGICIKSGAGFTLIELLITIFILTVGIVATIHMFPMGSWIGKSAQMATVAGQLAGEKIEEEISKSYEEISLGETIENYGTISGFPSYKRMTEITCHDPNGGISPNCPETGIKKIKVTVFWRSPIRISPKAEIVTFITNK